MHQHSSLFLFDNITAFNFLSKYKNYDATNGFSMNFGF